MSDTILVTAWSNGTPSKTGAGYGVRMRKEDRDRLVQRSWGAVTIELPDGTTARANVDGDSFWRGCSELRSAGIGRWMITAGKTPWPRGLPPSFKLTLVEPGRFTLSV